MIHILERLTESIQEHSPQAMRIVEPEIQIDYNEFNKNIRHQLKEIYDTKTSIEAALTESNYAYGTNSIAADAWSTAYFGTAPAANAAGCLWAPSWGIQPDPAKYARHSFCYFFRGGAVTLDVLDIAGGTTGTWTGAIAYDGNVNAFGAGTTGAYCPAGEEGRYTYINVYVASQLSQIYRFDSKNRVFSPYVATDFIQTGTATLGGRMAAFAAIDGTDEYGVVLLQSHLSTLCQELIPLV